MVGCEGFVHKVGCIHRSLVVHIDEALLPPESLVGQSPSLGIEMLGGSCTRHVQYPAQEAQVDSLKLFKAGVRHQGHPDLTAIRQHRLEHSPDAWWANVYCLVPTPPFQVPSSLCCAEVGMQVSEVLPRRCRVPGPMMGTAAMLTGDVGASKLLNA